MLPDDAEQPSVARATISEGIRARLKRNPMVSAIAVDKAEMFLRHGLFSADECTRIMEQIDAGSQPSKLFRGSGNAQYRTSSSCNLDPHDAFIKSMTQRIDALLGQPYDMGESLQGQRYQTGQEYQIHCDYFPGSVDYWPAMKVSGGQRCWTAMAYLCDVAEGGETHFPRLGLLVPPRRGTLLIWNNLLPDGAPNSETVHAARPVVKGSKYIVTRWYRERPWTPWIKP